MRHRTGLYLQWTGCIIRLRSVELGIFKRSQRRLMTLRRQGCISIIRPGIGIPSRRQPCVAFEPGYHRQPPRYRSGAWMRWAWTWFWYPPIKAQDLPIRYGREKYTAVLVQARNTRISSATRIMGAVMGCAVGTAVTSLCHSLRGCTTRSCGMITRRTGNCMKQRRHSVPWSVLCAGRSAIWRC